MSLASLMRAMMDAGASQEAIAIAVEAVEAANRRADAEIEKAEKARAERAAARKRQRLSRDIDATLPRQGSDSRTTVAPIGGDIDATDPLKVSPKDNISNPLPSSPADQIARTRDDLNRIEADCREAAGCGKHANPSPELCNLAPILGLLDGGADLEGEILPALRLKPNPRARGWKYFVPQIQQFRADRLAAASAGLPNARDGPPRRPTFAEINRVASEALRERDYPAPESQPANLVVLAGPRQGIG